MDVIVRISKEKKTEDFRMVIIPSGRSEIGLIRAKNYGIIAYPNKKDFEKIGEMIYWGFNESDDKVIEHLSNIKIEKRFYNCSSFRKVTNEYNEVWFEFFKGIYSVSWVTPAGAAWGAFEDDNKAAVESVVSAKPTALELGAKVMEMFEYKERYDELIE